MKRFAYGIYIWGMSVAGAIFSFIFPAMFGWFGWVLAFGLAFIFLQIGYLLWKLTKEIN